MNPLVFVLTFPALQLNVLVIYLYRSFFFLLNFCFNSKYDINYLRTDYLNKQKTSCFMFLCYKFCYLYLGQSKSIRKQKQISFAVWNLDSLPARDFARIPLIESLHSTYDFDMFGVCESMLIKNIPNQDILVNGFSPDPFRSDKDSDTRNLVEFAYISRNPYPLRRDMILKFYLKLL